MGKKLNDALLTDMAIVHANQKMYAMWKPAFPGISRGKTCHLKQKDNP
jgi:hypothetical protein